MLYNKNWDAKTATSDPLTLGSLIAWLEKQPRDGSYTYWDCRGACLLDLYISATTGKPSSPTPETHWPACGDNTGENYTYIAHTKPWTFGAALIRARKLAR